MASVLCYIHWGDGNKVSRDGPGTHGLYDQASQEYEGLAWATYDAAYHCKLQPQATSSGQK